METVKVFLNSSAIPTNAGLCISHALPEILCDSYYAEAGRKDIQKDRRLSGDINRDAKAARRQCTQYSKRR
jgi:hypothetical protein